MRRAALTCPPCEIAAHSAQSTPTCGLVTTIPLTVDKAAFSDYGLSVVDPTAQLSSLADRSAGAIDVVSTQTNTLVARPGQTQNLSAIRRAATTTMPAAPLAVPEPATLPLLAVGVLGLGVALRRGRPTGPSRSTGRPKRRLRPPHSRPAPGGTGHVGGARPSRTFPYRLASP